MSTAKPSIKIKGLSWSFGKQKVFSGVNAEFYPGQVYLIQGNNGCGKTTLFRLISSLLLPSTGHVQVHGNSTLTKTDKINRLVGFAPNGETGFFPRFSGTENLEFFCRLRQLNKTILNEKLAFWQDCDRISETLKTPFYKSSSGMKQILSLIRSDLHSPEVLLLDEPNRSLDSLVQKKLIQFVELKKAQRKTVVLTSHQEQNLLGPIDRVFKIDQRKIHCL